MWTLDDNDRWQIKYYANFLTYHKIFIPVLIMSQY